MDTKEYFAHRLQSLRMEKNISLSELAKELNTTAQSLSLYERAERTANIDLLCKVANYYNVSTDYLMGLSNKKNTDEDYKLDMTLKQAADISERLLGLSHNAIMTLATYYFDLKEFTAILNELFENEELLKNFLLGLSELSDYSYVSNKLFNDHVFNKNDSIKTANYYANQANATRYQLHFLLEKILDIYDYRKLYSVILAPFAEKLYNEVEEDIKNNGEHNPPKE